MDTSFATITYVERDRELWTCAWPDMDEEWSGRLPLCGFDVPENK